MKTNAKVMSVFLNEPKVEKGRLTYSWNQNGPLKGNSFWIEYPGIENITASSYELLVPYLPACLAFAAFGQVRVHLPFELDGEAMAAWIDILRSTARAVYRRGFGFELINGTREAERSSWEGIHTALLFGGGMESLLCLGRLRQEGVRPFLVGFCGPNWDGSNEEKNPHKFELENKICRDFGLTLIKIRTSFRVVFRSHDAFWKDLLKEDAWNIMTSAIFSAFTFTFIIPVAGQFKIGKVIGGNEKENNIGKFYFSFSHEATQRLKGVHRSIHYVSWLNDILKIQVAKELFTRHQDLLEYQYSCLENKHERWCCKCEKCLRNYLFYRIFDADPSVAGMDAGTIRRRLTYLVWSARWALTSGDPGKLSRYTAFREEAIRSQNKEALEILDRIFKNLFLSRFLNVLRRFCSLRSIKKPLRRIFIFCKDIPVICKTER